MINRETAVILIDVFEDFLDKKGIRIDNPDRDAEEVNGAENAANIFGEDFDNLMDSICETFANAGIHIPDAYDNAEEESESVEALTIYVPMYNDIIVIEEGTGDNLLEEDIANGVEDYLNYYVYDANAFENGEVKQIDGGMILYEELIQEKYSSMKDTVPMVLDMVYDTKNITWIEMSGGAEFRKPDMQIHTERGIIWVEASYQFEERAAMDGYSFAFHSDELGKDVWSKCLDDRGLSHTFAVIEGYN